MERGTEKIISLRGIIVFCLDQLGALPKKRWDVNSLSLLFGNLFYPCPAYFMCSARAQGYPDSLGPLVPPSPGDRTLAHHLRIASAITDQWEDAKTDPRAPPPHPLSPLSAYLCIWFTVDHYTLRLGLDLLYTYFLRWSCFTLMIIWIHEDWSSPLVFILTFGHDLAPSSYLAKSLSCWFLI